VVPRPPRRFFLKKALKTELNGVRRMTQKFNSIHSGGAVNGDFCRAEGGKAETGNIAVLQAFTHLYTPIHTYTRLRRKK
jgi:hypothetical protein